MLGLGKVIRVLFASFKNNVNFSLLRKLSLTFIYSILFVSKADANSCLSFLPYGFNESYVHLPQSASFCVKQGKTIIKYQTDNYGGRLLSDETANNKIQVFGDSQVLGLDVENIEQHYLNTLLNYSEKSYMHIPIALIDNRKLSKGNGDKLNSHNLSLILVEGLKFLKQKIQKDIEDGSTEEILKYASDNWDTKPFEQISSIELSPTQCQIVDNTRT